MLGDLLEACADPARLVVVRPPSAVECVSASVEAACEGAEQQALAFARGDGCAVVYVLDPAWGPVGRPRYRRDEEWPVTAEQIIQLFAVGAVASERGKELLAENSRP